MGDEAGQAEGLSSTYKEQKPGCWPDLLHKRRTSCRHGGCPRVSSRQRRLISADRYTEAALPHAAARGGCSPGSRSAVCGTGSPKTCVLLPATALIISRNVPASQTWADSQQICIQPAFPSAPWEGR